MKKSIVDALTAWSTERPDNVADRPASIEEIHAAELRLGVEFPEDYKWFLSTFGGGQLGPLSVVGLHWSENMSIYEKDIFVAKDFYWRPWMAESGCFIFSGDECGNNWMMNSEGVVYFADHEEQRLTKKYNSFSDWFENELMRN
jgi:hypothetical protein